MKIVRAGRRTHRNFPEVDEWMDNLAEKASEIKDEVTVPLTVKVLGQFRDGRHPDLHNLHKIIGDGLEKGLNINDKDMLIRDEGVEEGHTFPGLDITLEWIGRQKILHTCKENDAEFSVENLGDGWYLYFGDSRGQHSINFCPYCGKKLENETTRAT